MNDLVFLDNFEVLTDSIRIAEQFGKKHKNVIRDIESLLSFYGGEINGLKFEPISYIDSMNREQKKYFLCRDASMLVIMGYRSKKALDIKVAYIRAFNEMARYIKDQYSIRDQLLETIKKEDISFSNGSKAGKALQKRKLEKPILKERIEELNDMLQVDWLRDLRIK